MDLWGVKRETNKERYLGNIGEMGMREVEVEFQWFYFFCSF